MAGSAGHPPASTSGPILVARPLEEGASDHSYGGSVKRTSHILPVLALMGALAAPTLAATAPAAKTAPASQKADNAPFWTGHPNAAAFAKMHDGRIARAKADIARMLAVKGTRTLANTLRPYDEAQIELDAASSQAGLMENVHPDSTLRAAAEKVSQKVSAYATELSLNRRVYDALTAIDRSKADDATRYYLEKELRDFRLAGVDKDEATRKRVQELRDELVKIGQDFDRNIRSDVRTITVAGAADLDGLPADFIANHKPGAEGRITLDINYPDYIPVMSYCKSDDVRHRLYMEYNNRAYPKNMEVLKRMFARRYELAKLLGYDEWADYITANKMVGNAKNVRDFIDKIVTASGPRADREYQVLLKRKQKDVPGAIQVNLWESNYWSEAVRKSDYNFDSQSVRPYLAYDKVKPRIDHL